MMIASPIIQKITFDIFNPYLEENIILKTGDGAAYMSMFLARANPKLRGLTRNNEDFLTNVDKLADNEITSEQFRNGISESIEPFTTEFDINKDNMYSAISYPVIYLEEKGIFCDESVDKIASSIIESDWFDNYKDNMNGMETYAPVFYQEENGEQHVVPAANQPGPIDICGAGDACSAGLVTALCAGGSYAEAAFMGNLSSGVTVREIGRTGMATREKMLALYDEQWGE